MSGEMEDDEFEELWKIADPQNRGVLSFNDFERIMRFDENMTKWELRREGDEDDKDDEDQDVWASENHDSIHFKIYQKITPKFTSGFQNQQTLQNQ